MDVVKSAEMNCLQSEDKSTDRIRREYGVSECKHPTAEKLIAAIQDKDRLIFDLDLDLFIKSGPFYYEGDSQFSKILALLDKCDELIKKAQIITIAKSPIPLKSTGYDWIWDKDIAESVTRAVVPRIIEIRDDETCI